MTQIEKKYLNNNHALAIIGIPHSAKTSLAVYIRRTMPKRKAYALGYPEKLEGFMVLEDKEDINRISQCILFIDEISKYFPVYEKDTNKNLIEFLRFCEANKVKLVITTQNSQDFTKSVEALIPQWCIKQIIPRTLKNGSTARHVLKCCASPRVTKSYLNLDKNEYIFYDNFVTEPGVNARIYTFPDPKITKAWSRINSDKTEKNTEQLPETTTEYSFELKTDYGEEQDE